MAVAGPNDDDEEEALMTKLRIATISVAGATAAALMLVTGGAAVAAPAGETANSVRAGELAANQAAVVGSTQALIETRFAALRGAVDTEGERAAVESARAALAAQARRVDEVTRAVAAELRQMLRLPASPAVRGQYVANEARAVALQRFQEAVVRSTHQVIGTQISALRRVLSGASEKAAVEPIRVALHANAKHVHVTTQRTMTELLQMLRRSINQLG